MLLPLWIFIGIWVNTESAQDFRPGVCPPNPKSNKQCSYVSDECKNDSNCPGVQKCCPNECTANSCKDPLLKDRPGCPPFDPDLRCIQFIQQCNSDNDCKKDELCCFQPACGTSCTKKISEDKCPPYRKDVICKRYINNCDCNSDCPKGQVCCTVECGKDCRTPTPNVECPLIKCIGLPPGVCSRDTYTYIGGKKCKMCPEIIPCDKDCLLPKKVGSCDGKHPRYYYDVNSQSCQKFYYGGCDGNANNFWTLEDCLRECATGPIGTCPTVKCAPPPSDVCTEDVFIIVNGKICKGCPKIVPCKTVCSLPKKPGTCYAYVPRYYYNTETKSCEQFIYGGCNGNANNFETLQECNQKCDCNPNICSLPKQPGPCKAYFPRYYYDTTTHKCEKFIYGGCQGNANNFETLEECQQKCGSNPNVCDLPKQPGPCKAYFPRYYYDTTTNKCEKFIYGGCQGNDNNFETLEECQQKCGSNPNVCNLPKQPGPCKAYMPRYYYDVTTKSCEKFIYGGCQGNANNFETLEECQQKCDSNTNVCDLPKKVGPCEAAIPRYYYDKATQACQNFIYGGCQGNANNFETLDECKRRCDKNSNVCDLPKDTGPCRGSFQRYYFDTTTKTCKTFIYGGCQGNANNFNTLKECQTKCGVTPIKCGPVCLIFCEFGNVLDENGCPTCKCKPDPCSSAPKCAIPGPGVCFEPTYKMIDGVKCHWCYQIVPCKPEGLLKCPTDLLSKYACANYKMTCSSDSSCPKGQKCCKQDCGFRCVHGV